MLFYSKGDVMNHLRPFSSRFFKKVKVVLFINMAKSWPYTRDIPKGKASTKRYDTLQTPPNIL